MTIDHFVFSTYNAPFRECFCVPVAIGMYSANETAADGVMAQVCQSFFFSGRVAGGRGTSYDTAVMFGLSNSRRRSVCPNVGSSRARRTIDGTTAEVSCGAGESDVDSEAEE